MLLLFAVPEGLALADPSEGDTFSENIRQWIADVWLLTLIGWVVFATWFGVHIWGRRVRSGQDEER